MKKSKKGRPMRPTSKSKQTQLRLHPDELEKCAKMIKHRQAQGNSEIRTRSALLRWLINDYHLPGSYQ